MYCPLDQSRPCPFPLKPTQTYLGEDDQGYYVMDGFLDNVGNMFKRMVKFTPKSFTPGNIWKGVRNTMLTGMTGGIYLALPKGVKKTIERVSDVAIPVVAGAAAAYAVGPAVMGMIGPKLSTVASALGKNISTVGKGLFDVMGKLSPAQQSQVADRVTAQDLMYAEQNQGQFPPQFVNYVDEVAKQNYGYAVNASLNPQQSDPRQYYADAGLYPGLQQTAMQPPQEPDSSGNWSSGEVIGAVGAAVAVAVLLSRK